MIGWSRFYLLLFVYRCVLSVLAQTVITGFTVLGDAKQYQNASFDFSGSWFLDSNVVTGNLGAFFQLISFGNPVMVNLWFQAVGFYGIYRLMEALDSPARRRMALLVLFPSFNLWTSIASKEALLLFSLGIVGAYIVDAYRGKERLRPMGLLGAGIIAVFKPHYAPALLLLVGVPKLARGIRQASAFMLLALPLTLVPLYVFRDGIDRLSFEIAGHFEGGRATREAFWVEQYDVFEKAPLGMFLGFFGPTFREAFLSGNLLQVVSFFESGVLLLVLLFFFARTLPRQTAVGFMAAIMGLFWIVFTNYPFAVLNPGSAVRYRSGYLLLIFLIIVLLGSRGLYRGWRRRRDTVQDLGATRSPT